VLPTRDAQLRRFGHAFLHEHKRLPTVTEVASGMRLSAEEAADLAVLAHAPLCAADDIARKSYAMIQTGERRFYGCFMFRKGVIPPDA
jgi:L-fucose mutarotase/ribose pyranase (RbsD/FucU family)